MHDPQPHLPADPRWRGLVNAECYDAFVRDHSVYRWLNHQLVDVGAIEGCRRVLDLGCGTGATTRTALGAIAVHGEVVGLDGSPEMVEVARATTVDPRAAFLVGDAAALEQIVEGTFDAALSNAAFWQFPHRDRVWASLRRRLAEGATFTFNVPADRQAESGPSHGFQVALHRAIERRAGRLLHSVAGAFDLDASASLAAEHGFVEEARELRVWRGPQRELIELMRIPAMTRPLVAGLEVDDVAPAVEEAARAVDPEEQVEVGWVYVRTRLASASATPSSPVAAG